MTGAVLKVLRAIGAVAIGAPRPPRATGGYGLACRGALILLFIVGVLVSLWRPGAGLSVLIVAALALQQFFLLQYRGWLLRPDVMAWLAAIAVSSIVVISVVWSRWEDDGSGADVMLLAALVGTVAVLPLVRVLFLVIFGPHHPESPIPDRVDPAPLWFWIGGVGPNRASITVRVAAGLDATAVRVVYVDADGGGERRTDTVAVDHHRLATVALTGLEPDHRYDIGVEAVSGNAAGGSATIGTGHGSFITFPADRTSASVRLAFASCTSTGSRGRVFDTIAELEPRPRIFVISGDLHYENLTSTQPERFLNAFDQVHSSDPQRRLYNSMPIAYLWDDHDYGDNDSGADSPSRDAARSAYRSAVPHYLESADPGPINQEFTIGRVRVLMTDNRSERAQSPGHLFGRDQERWLVDRITDPTWPLVIWVSSTPWISDETGSDNWGAYADQRGRIATAIGDRSANMLMVSGDAHMVAIDDGSNSSYAGPGSGFPVLHAAALDRLGSTKGGPFSHGMYPGGGQFGIVDIADRGHEIDVRISGRSWTGTEIVGHSFAVSAASTSQNPESRTSHSPPSEKGHAP